MKKQLLILSFIFFSIISFSQGRTRTVSLGKLKTDVIFRVNENGSYYKYGSGSSQKINKNDWVVLAYEKGLVIKNSKKKIEIKIFAEMVVPYHYMKSKKTRGKDIKGNNVLIVVTKNGIKQKYNDYASFTFYKEMQVIFWYGNPKNKYRFYLEEYSKEYYESLNKLGDL